MIKIYDSKSRKKVEFEPLNEGAVGFYVCGPTVYDVAHLGHGRSAVAFDVIRRYFEYREYDVKFVSNYTDVDDKMINRARAEGISVKELSEKIIPEYEKDYGDLGVKPADIAPKATDHIADMISLIERLEEKGFVYVIDGDGVYFDVEKYPSYGDLSGQKLEDLKMGARVEVNESKRNPYDFALWKFQKNDDEPSWPSKWGEGRPGWHVECSAMSYHYLGEKFDIHGGGLDLLFPHHECEVAQSCGAFGAEGFAKYWIHNGFINVDNEKMSKSLGNFFTLKDIFEKYDPQVVRFMFLQTHYRNPINFSDKLLDQAKAGLERIHGFVRSLKNITKNDSDANVSDNVSGWVDEALAGFESAMDDDFDTSGALGSVFEMVKKMNVLMSEGEFKKVDAEAILAVLKKIDEVFGMIFFKEEMVGKDIESLIKEREDARKNKDFARSDEIRDELLKKGIVLEDTLGGTVWKRG